MAWLVRCSYRPGGARDRLPVRAEHIRHMLAWLPRTVFGAAVLEEATGEPAGMVVVLAVDSREEAQRFTDSEPYCRAGLFATIELTPLVQMTPPHTPDFLLGELQHCE
jgi:uncharacterized protein YciI